MAKQLTENVWLLTWLLYYQMIQMHTPWQSFNDFNLGGAFFRNCGEPLWVGSVIKSCRNISIYGHSLIDDLYYTVFLQPCYFDSRE